MLGAQAHVLINVKQTKFLIEKELLMKRSAYFHNLIASAESTETPLETTITIEESDVDMFKKLLYLIRSGRLPAGSTTGLAEMASFYLVDYPYIDTVKKTAEPSENLYVFKGNDRYTPLNLGDMMKKSTFQT
jgi:hypothetical protein